MLSTHKAMSQPTTPSRTRLSSKTSGTSSLSPVAQKSRGRSVVSNPIDGVNKESKLKRSLMLNKPKSGEQLIGSQNGVKPMASRSVNRPVIEQFARPRRLRPLDSSSPMKNGDQGFKELQEKLQSNESLIKDLQSQVLALKEELDKAHSVNLELELQNKKLEENLAASEAKVAAFSIRAQESNGEQKSPNFKDIQKFVANKLENSTVKKEVVNRSIAIKPPCPPPPPAVPSLPPPPPPPPPMRPLSRAPSAPKTPAIVQFYHSLRKQEEKREPIKGQPNQYKTAVTNVHNSIVGEIQNRSAHLLAIKADVETKGDFINGLIQKVLDLAYADIEDVLKFVDWLDSELSTLADERAVLKHFNWPERKADAIREAAIEYRALKLLETEISSFKDDTDIPCETALKKMAILLDKSERGIARLIKLRSSVLRSYQDWKIPINWMLNCGIVSKIKQASMKLAKMYMRRVIMELELARNSDRETSQEALVRQGVHFAYRAHQFTGGLDSETLCAFEEIRQHVPGHLGRSRELLAAIPSS